MKDSLVDLNSLLFEQIERLCNPDLSEEEIRLEMQRSTAVSGLAKNIINNGDLVLRAAKFSDERMDVNNKVPKMLIGDGGGSSEEPQ